MLSRFSYIEQRAQKKRVLYEGTSVIYQGMPVCYNYDTTNNIDGYDAVVGAAQATTAEGNQNEGKYVRVEDPANNNLLHFAGVVAGTEHEGKTGTGEIWLEIYVPNGAIVPCRCDVDTTVGVTILGITVSSQELGRVVEGTSRPVGIAMETETALDGTAGITLVKLDPNLFIYQDLDGTALGVGTGSDSIAVNRINVTCGQTSGRFTAFQIRAFHSGGAPSSWDYGFALDVAADLMNTSEITNGFNASGHWLNIGDVTVSGGSNVSALRAGIYNDGNSTLTASGCISPLSLAVQFSDQPATNKFAMIYARSDGSIHPDVFLYAEDANACAQNASGGTMGANDTCALFIEIRIGGTQYWIPTFTDAELAS